MRRATNLLLVTSHLSDNYIVKTVMQQQRDQAVNKLMSLLPECIYSSCAY